MMSEWLPIAFCCLGLMPGQGSFFFFFFSSGQGSTLSGKAALSYFGQLLLYIDSFHILTVTGLRRTGLDNSCSKVLDSNSIYSLNVLIIRLNVYSCVIKKKGGFFFFFFGRQVGTYPYTCPEAASDYGSSIWKGLLLLDSCRTFLS